MIALSPTSYPVECAGTRHHLVWQDGRLAAFDHPDPDRERALTAMGGETYRCLQLLDVWEQHADDLDVLLLAPRGPQDRLASSVDHTSHGPRRGGASFGWYAYSPLTSASAVPSRRPVGMRDVLRLGGRLPDRLAAQVISAWSARLDAGDAAVEAARPRLHAALYGRFTAAVRNWLGDPSLRIDLTMTPPGSATAIERGNEKLQVQLPFAWLVEIWLPGFAVVADRLCVSARQPQPRRFELESLDRALTRRSTLTLEVDESR